MDPHPAQIQIGKDHRYFLVLILSAIAATLHAAESTCSRTNLMEFVDETGRLAPIRSVADWEQRRAAILRAMEQVMGPLPDSRKRCPLELEVNDDVDCGGYRRQCLSYASEPGSRVPAYLLIPRQAAVGAPCPAVLCLHQTHRLGQEVVVGLGQSPNDEYGVELANQGYVCLVPAYPLLANYHPDLTALGYTSGTMKAIWDNVRGLDLLDSLPFVRHGACGVIGHSLGGHNGVFTAIFDSRIKIVVSSCGLDAFRDYMGGDIRGWTSQRYMPHLRSYRAGQVPFDFDELISALAPRVILLSAPEGDSNFRWWSVDDVVGHALPIYELYGQARNIHVEHPNCGHEFPREMREMAYRLIDQVLGAGESVRSPGKVSSIPRSGQ
jgi:hypothetical protein